MASIAPLPVYPSTEARKTFSASQSAQFHVNLANALAHIIALPSAKRDVPSTRAFVSSYASDAARQILEALIWGDSGTDDRLLRRRVLFLAEKVAGLEPRTLLDLCVAFPLNVARLRSILSAALGGTPGLPATFATEVVPAFTSLLSPSRSSGLYGLRKTARCLASLLRPSPPALVRPFAHSKDFIVALARTYDDGLAAISQSYGGIRTTSATSNLDVDDWERIWLETKVDIVDTFHLIVTTMVQDISTASGPTQLAVEADRAFETVFALLEITPPAPGSLDADSVPFLNRPLVTDYQYAYDLCKTLSSALRDAAHEDARMELLESTLRSPDSSESVKDPGALKLILRSSGIVPEAPSKATLIQPTSKGKAKAAAPAEPGPHDPDLDLQVTRVLDIFPDYSPEYIHRLLSHPSFPFRGNAERAIEALLEGTAPDEDTLGESFADSSSIPVVVPAVDDAPIERRNVFDQEAMDLSRVRVGKKTLDMTSLTRDGAETKKMKAEILRLAEAMSEDSDEEIGAGALDIMDLDEDLDERGASTIRVLGGGEDSDDGHEENSEQHVVEPIKPETILELAYIRDPKLFDRDAETRRSKPRADLKQKTGWTDEQIEGWKIMLEKNPKKDRILEKHEFSGNKIVDMPVAGGTTDQPSSGRGRGRGGGRARGRGRGNGERRGGGEKSDDVKRERAFKEKHKSNSRKRGHEKKMARAGVGPSM